MIKRPASAASSPKLRVKLRVDVMRALGEWYLDQSRKYPELDIDAETRDFFVSLSRRTGSFVELDRGFAERFATECLKALGEKNPAALLQVGPHYEMPTDSDCAIAEICIEIKKALNRRKGRPQLLDPLLAYEANLKHKHTRKRSARGQTGDAYSHELVGNEFGVTNKGAIADAIAKGVATNQRINSARALLPPDAEVLFVLTDASESGQSGVLAALVPPRKKNVD